MSRVAEMARALGMERLGRGVYDAYLRRVGNRRGIEWELNGEIYRIDPAYRGQIGHRYDAEVADFLRARIQPGQVCFNIGANIGVYALQLSRWLGPEGRVVAFEPNPAAETVLRRHVEFNDLGSRVDIVPAAVAEQPGEAVLYTIESDARGRLGAPNPELERPAREVVVPVTTIDAYVRETGITPDWILLDIEGFEIPALRGARELFRSQGQRLSLLVEMHPNVWDSAGVTREDAERLVDEFGLDLVPLSGQADPLGDYGHVLLRARTREGSSSDG